MDNGQCPLDIDDIHITNIYRSIKTQLPSYIQFILSMNVILPVAISYFIIYVCTVHHCFPRPIKPAGTFINSLMCSNAGQECDIIHPGIHLCEYKKIDIYCPQGSGTLCQQLLMMHWLCSKSQNMTEYARLCQSMPECARVCQSMPMYARVCQYMPEYAGVCQCTPEYARVC